MPVTNWTEFFRQHRDIYVQNISSAQVSLEFELSPGHIVGHLFTHTRNPVNLTQHIPFEAIQQSVNFRKMLNRRPAVLQVLTEEEYQAYYARKATEWRLPDASAAIDRAEEQRQGIAQRRIDPSGEAPKPIHEVVEDGKHLGERKLVRSADVVSSDEVIHPRVLDLCNQVGVNVDEDKKMAADKMLDALEAIEGDLKIDDLEYLRSHGFWKSIKKWAQTRVADMLAAEVGEGDG